MAFHTKQKSSFTICSSFLLICLFFAVQTLGQQKVVPLYNGAAPGSENWNWEEGQAMSDKPAPVKFPIAYNISKPTLTVFSPDSANGTAIIICPGGGFYVLNIETEGSKVAKELNKKGITVFLLKYRVAHIITDNPWEEMMKNMKDSARFQQLATVKKMAMEDAKNAIYYVRQHAAEYKIDPNRVGIIGFSAGGSLARGMAYNYTPETRPDFAAVIYAGIGPEIKPMIPTDAPPLFIAGATDDKLVPVSYNINLYHLWVTANRSAEVHLYAKGGHGLWGIPASSWITRFEEWLSAQGF